MNPFQSGGIVTKDTAYCPRATLETQLREAVTSNERVAWLGERSTGKSTLIDFNLRHWEVPYARIDLMRLASREDLVERIHRSLDAAADMRATQTAGRAGTWWTNIKRGFNAKVEAKVPGFGGVSIEGAKEERQTLGGALERINRESRSLNGMVVFFDEFHEVVSSLGEKEGNQVLGLIRGAIQGHRDTAYMFAGSDARQMWMIFTDRSQPFANTARTIRVEPIPNKEFLEWTSNRLKEGRRELMPEAGVLMLEKGRGQLESLQKIAHAYWSESSPGDRIDGVLAEKSLRVVMGNYEMIGGDLLDRSTEAQKRLLLGVATFGGNEVFSSDFLRRSGLTKTQVQNGLEQFGESRGGYLDNRRGDVQFRDALLREWLIRQEDMLRHYFRHVPDRERTLFPALSDSQPRQGVLRFEQSPEDVLIPRMNVLRSEYAAASQENRAKILDYVNKTSKGMVSEVTNSTGIAFRRAVRDFVEGKIGEPELLKKTGALKNAKDHPLKSQSQGIKL